MKRYLVHGPCLNDLGELLFFDAWIWPCATAVIRPRTLESCYIGYPMRDIWPRPVLEALETSGLAISLGRVLWSEPANAAPGEFSAFVAPPMAETFALTSDLMSIPLHSPATEAETGAWLTEIDGAGRRVATYLGKRGHLVTSKQFAQAITRVFKPGWDIALALVLPAFPRIDRAMASMTALQAFLADSCTRARREALYEWPILLGRSDLPIQAVARRVADAAADYASWVEASGFASGGRGKVELLWKIDDAQLAEELAAAPVSQAAGSVAQLRRRGLAERELADCRSDTPAALVCHRPRGYP